MKFDVSGAELSQTCEEIFSSDQQPGDTVIVGAGRESENSLNDLSNFFLQASAYLLHHACGAWDLKSLFWLAQQS